MNLVTRRNFLELVPGAFSTPFAGRLFGQPPHYAERTKILMVMFGTAPSVDDTDLRPLTHKDIVRRLEKDCEGVDFAVRDLTAGAKIEAVVKEAQEAKRLGYDGVIVYGWPRDYDLLRSGLPTINIYILNDFQNVPYPIFRRHRVIPASLDPWHFCADPKVSERMFTDLIEKVKLIRALKRMRSEHILVVSDSKFVSVVYGDVLKQDPDGYNESILAAIRETFGTRVTKIGTPDVVEDRDIQKLWRDDSPQANEIAERWIRNSAKMTYTLKSEVVRSARMYLALKLLLEKHQATAMAFHIRTLVKNPRPEDLVYPALATSEFQLHNMVVKCQAHLNVVLSEMLLQYAYGRPSMLGDYMVDVYNGTSCVQHCEGPWNPWGGDRLVPYILTDHRERRVRARNAVGGGAASWVLYPPDEPVTMWQIEVLNKEVLVHTGKTVHMLTGPVMYRDHLWEMM